MDRVGALLLFNLELRDNPVEQPPESSRHDKRDDRRSGRLEVHESCEFQLYRMHLACCPVLFNPHVSGPVPELSRKGYFALYRGTLSSSYVRAHHYKLLPTRDKHTVCSLSCRAAGTRLHSMCNECSSPA